MAKRRKTTRKTYKKKRTAKNAARGHEVYKVKGGWRVSRGNKVRGKRGRAQRARARARKPAKRKAKKKARRYIITLGNPHPEICGYPDR